MRTTITSIVIILCIVFSTATIFTINNYYTRKNEVEESLTSSIEKAAKKMKLEKNNGKITKEQIEGEFLQNLIIQIDSDSDISVVILECDIEKGIFDVDVTETYKWFGLERHVNVRRTVIVESSNNKVNSKINVIYKISESNLVTVTFESKTITKITETTNGISNDVTVSNLLTNVSVGDSPESLYFIPNIEGFKNWKEDGNWEKKGEGIIVENSEKTKVNNLVQDIMFVAEY